MTIHDVTIVGAGPVGLALARALGRMGHDVVVVERWATPYPLPRAVHFDDEIGRLFDDLGIGQEVRRISAPVPDHYEWRNAAGEKLVGIDWSGNGPSGWPTASFFSQPQLEEVLRASAAALPSVTMVPGATAVDLQQDAETATITCQQDGREVDFTSRYVVGCDGANSFVRTAAGIPVHDEGFYFDWLIVDTLPKDDLEWSPQNWQLCDPVRPTTIVSGGPGRRRWEFMRLPHETKEELNTPAKAWELLEGWGRTPDNSVLERHALYTFAARWADEWRRGRVLIAGDAAHQMPPFAGQGMCSGLRDVANLWWKLDRVLRGASDAGLLDSYGTERCVHLQHAISMSVELGRVICVLDEEAAAARDQRMLAGEADPAKVLPVSAEPILGPGVLGGSGHPLVGTAAPQPPVGDGSRTLDELIDPGDMVLLDGRRTTALPTGMRGVVIGGTGGLGDPTGEWGRWFDQHGIVAALVRPDHYVYDVATTGDGVQAITDAYVRALLPTLATV